MQCQALTKKGLQCSHRATYPEENPVTCKIWAHMQQGERDRPVKKQIKIIVKSITPAKTKSYIDKQTLDRLFSKEEDQLDAFLERKQEITSVLNELYSRGLNLKKGDSQAAIDYLKSRFTKDIANVNLKILAEGIGLLESYQRKLIVLLTKYDVDDEYAVLKTDFLRHQLDRTISLINILKNLHSSPKGGQSIPLVEFLKEHDMEELETESILSAAPAPHNITVAVPKVSIKQAVKLKK